MDELLIGGSLRIIFFTTLFYFSSYANTIAHLQIFVPPNIQPAQSFELTLQFNDSQGIAIKDFDLNHEKLNHTIIVSQDLNSFAHIHPEYQSNGSFSIQLNQPQNKYDNDNADAAQAVTQPGNHLIFSEVLVRGETNPRTFNQNFSVDGEIKNTPLTLDGAPFQTLIKYFKKDNSVGTNGDAYKMSLNVMQMTGMVHFIFKFEELIPQGGTNHYEPIPQLENWLGMPGHGILIGESGLTAQDKFFKHMHIQGHHHGSTNGHAHSTKGTSLTGNKLEFVLMGADVPPPGIYKLWGQFKYNGTILTFPFIFELQ